MPRNVRLWYEKGIQISRAKSIRAGPESSVHATQTICVRAHSGSDPAKDLLLSCSCVERPLELGGPSYDS
ncbi:hypothetical protein Hypma_010760 [Hypsizygus marmoreus]|uniref:Uncharacterized protein n=1 Tax=Hypsizygus marmoreus TaxID=39966 RepID=A0A369JNU3_HYPMA|nr:hypothetical protein Hypma_010760 [Hypsizygus marmoreus]